jgi:hypothetical protein
MKEKKKSRFSGAVSSNAVKQKEKSNFGYLNLPEGVSMFKIDSGKSMFFDILPYEVTDKNHPDKKAIALTDGLWYRRPFLVHSIPNGEHTDKVVCPTSFGKPCPICEYVKQMKDAGTSFEELKPFKAKERNLYVVIPYGHKEMEEKPYIWDDTQWYFQKMLNDELAENSDNECFPDLENGLMLKVRFSDDTYNNKPAPKPTRIDFKDREENGGQQYTEKILKKIPNLDEVLIVLSYKELEMKLSGIEDSDLDESENKDAVKAFDRKKKPIKDDDDTDEVEPNSGETKSSKRKKSEPVKKAWDEKHLIPTWGEIQGMEYDELMDLVEENNIDLSECGDDEEELRSFLIVQLEIEKPTKKSSNRRKSEPEKGSKKKPIEDDDDDEYEKSEATEIRIGSMVNHPKYGECEIVALNKKEMTATLADEDEERHVGIPFHKFNVISFGKAGEPGKITKKETEARRKPAKEDKKTTGKNKCPNGHVFGTDFEKFKDCSDCPKWDDCSDE